MSFFDDYVADGLCCQSCGAYLGGDEPGFARFCVACDPARQPPKPKPKRDWSGASVQFVPTKRKRRKAKP